MRNIIGTWLCTALLVGSASASSYAAQAATAPAQDKSSPAAPSAGTSVDAHQKDVAWDEFRHRTNMVWACRNIYTGFFVNVYQCADQPREDNVWPDKEVPSDYAGEGIAVSLREASQLTARDRAWPLLDAR